MRHMPTPAEIEARIAAWHAAPDDGTPLHAALGWTEAEYERWVRDPAAVPPRALPTTLRAKIEAEIKCCPDDPAAAAKAVCLLLEDEIGGLAGNGWFDNDPEMRAVFFDADED